MAAKLGMRFSNLIAPGLKLCGTCRRVFPLANFHKRSACKDGHAPVCGSCHRDYMREYVKRNRNLVSHAKSNAEYRIRNPEKEIAHSIVRKAIRLGELVRPEICPGCDETIFVEAHHNDYKKPLEINWLCSKCHGLEHRNYIDLSPVINVWIGR
jgi:hypothetical protein